MEMSLQQAAPCSFVGTSCFTVVHVEQEGEGSMADDILGAVHGRDEAHAIIQDPLDGNVIAAGQVQTTSGAQPAGQRPATIASRLYSHPA